MIYLDISINNLYSFKNSNVNLSYPKRNRKSPLIEYEFLEGRENFRYKRVIILSGSNASGKTAFGRVLCAINNFIAGRDFEKSLMSLNNAIKDKNKEASFTIYFVTPENHKLHYLNAKFESDTGLIYEEYASSDISTSDSYEKSKDKLDKLPKDSRKIFNAYDAEIKNIGFRSYNAIHGNFNEINNCWSYLFCQNSLSDKELNYQNADTKILEKILIDFDNSIKEVFYEASNNTINIKFDNDDLVLIKNGEMNNSDRDRLSRGTYEAIQTASFFEYLCRNPSCIYFFDEKLSYAHSELEQSVLNLMIEKLGRDAQLFYTTHNYDILELNLPIHSFIFMRKAQYSEFINAESKMNKNDRSLYNYVRNDVYNTTPQTLNIDSLL